MALEVTSKQARAFRAFMASVEELPLQKKITEAVNKHGSFEGDLEYLNDLTIDDIITLVVTGDFRIVYTELERHEYVLSALYLGEESINEVYAAYLIGLKNSNKFFGGTYDHPILDDKYIFVDSRQRPYSFPPQFEEADKEYEYIHKFPNQMDDFEEFLIKRGL
ncbi:hypothetical protein I907_gp69 [Bacillus phage Eoghan]|uniref:Uncharacterized protein n=2 Tax=Andromedavirus TaxID=1623275 RepID=M1I982_9CAUD|nr:hypothetical protein I907_gp69 [Bacillus phage Eoghan]YP_009592302.1 hypothetical protein FDG68_gp69 [Bacillus phage Taylor]AGE60833.1 hypothetical protein EOGHAN_70 [Bacillus phage Eoghan]AGE60987.1 hypothetical protein TAYLOR_69 [Bacillus phage Taylor]